MDSELFNQYVVLRIRRYLKTNPQINKTQLITKLLCDKDFRFDLAIELSDSNENAGKLLGVSERTVCYYLKNKK